jgi:hypothetical protein
MINKSLVKKVGDGYIDEVLKVQWFKGSTFTVNQEP